MTPETPPAPPSPATAELARQRAIETPDHDSAHSR